MGTIAIAISLYVAYLILATVYLGTHGYINESTNQTHLTYRVAVSPLFITLRLSATAILWLAWILLGERKKARRVWRELWL